MKKYLVIPLTLIFSALLYLTAFAFPRSTSYRDQTTAGFFKNNYDRISDNPAYVGASLKIFDYTRVKESGGEKEQKSTTDLYTTLDGLNTDGRFLLGGLGSFGSIGIGGYAELGLNESPQALSYSSSITNPTFGTSAASLSGLGSGEASDVIYYGAGTNAPYSGLLTTKVKEENNLIQNNLNFRLALGGLDLGIMTLGLAFERNTDGTNKTINTGEYQGSALRLADNFFENTNSGARDYKTKNNIVNNLVTLGMVVPMGGFLQTVELMLTYNMIQNKQSTNNRDQTTAVATGVDTYTTNTENISKNDQGGNQLGVTLVTREQVAGWNLQTYVSFDRGGTNPYKDSTSTYENGSNTSYFNDTNRINSSSVTSTTKTSGDGRSRSLIGAGLLSRKEVAKGLLVGFGVTYLQESTKNEYSRINEATAVTRLDDGDGIDENTDYTLVRSGSYEEGITVKTKSHTVTIPIGIEFQATPTLTWRLGAIHTTSYTSTSTNTKFNTLSALYDDYDYADVAGNETDSDARVNPSAGSGSTIVGAINFDPSDRDNVQRSVSRTMTNSFYLGLGYLMQNKIQLDLMLQATSNSEIFSAASVYASATYMIE